MSRNVRVGCIRCGFWIAAALILGASPRAAADTLFVPALTVAGRYDSNIFSSPKLPGLRLDDWVSTVTPQLNVIHQGSLAQGSVRLTGVGEQYLHNDQLNYFGGVANVSLVLNRLVQRVIPRLSFNVTNSTIYTPQAPSFAAPTVEGDPNLLLRGIQIARVDTFLNSSSANLSYAFDRTFSLRLGYSYSVIRFGHPSVNAANAGVVNTDSESISVGPQWQVSLRDSLFMNYVYQRTRFVGGQLPGFPSSFQTHGGTIGWSRAWSPEWRSSVFAGVASVEEGTSFNDSGGTTTNQGGVLLTYTAGATLVYSEALSGTATAQLPLGGFGVGGIGGIGGLSGAGGAGVPGGSAMAMVGGSSKMFALNYSAGVFPGFVAGGVPLISHVVSASFFRRLSVAWGVACGADYARNDSLSKQPGAQDISASGYGGNGAVSYFLTPTLFGSVTADYHRFEGQGLAVSGAVSGAAAELDRFVAMLSITKVWY